MASPAEQRSNAIAALLEVVYAWQEKTDTLITTGAFDDEVVATHDSKGRLLELWVRPGLQQELTTEELEERMNEAISDNAHRAHAAFLALGEQFRERFVSVPQEYLDHPAAEELVRVYRSAREPQTTEESR